MIDSDRTYYERRAATEREMAAAAGDPRIAAIHMELAERYYHACGVQCPSPDRVAETHVVTE